ncbi:hypothetical protein KI387_029663, partial [Taxus chinensis]
MYSAINCKYVHLYEPSMLDEDEELQFLHPIEDCILESQGKLEDVVLHKKIRETRH